MRGLSKIANATLICLGVILGGNAVAQQESNPTDKVSASQSGPVAPAPPAAAVLVPPLMRYSGVVNDNADKPLTGPVDVSFSIYKDQNNGEPLWQETQTVRANEHGHYTVLLGVTRELGLPMELFQSGEARWLGVSVGDSPEQPRILLVSVPYAFKAGDAEMLGGKPASAYALAPGDNYTSGGGAPPTSKGPILSTLGNGKAGDSLTSGTSPSKSTAMLSGTGTANYVPVFSNPTTLVNSDIFDSAGAVGILTSTPANTLDIRGGLREAPAQLATTSGEFVVMEADKDTVHSVNAEEGANPHIRLSMASAPVGYPGATDLLIAPYKYGFSLEHKGVFQIQAGASEVMPYVSGTQAEFWVADERDGGGLCHTTHYTGSPATSFSLLAVEPYGYGACQSGGDFGSMLFRVGSSVDSFQFQTGTGVAPKTNFAIWGTGDVSIGNASDLAMLSVGSSGQFTVSSSGALAASSGMFSGSTGAGAPLQVVQPAVDGVGELTTSAGYMGIWGQTTNTSGTGVRGEATAATGASVGVFGVARSLSGIAGRFDNTVGGTILSGTRDGEPRFNVDGSGNVTATGSLTATSASLSGVLTATTGNFSGPVSAAGVVLPMTATATSGHPAKSSPLDWVASSFANGSPVNELFRWQAEGNGSGNTASLNLLFGSAGATPTETGLSINNSGVITFAPGQAFPGAQSALAAGTGIAISGNTISNAGVTGFNGRTGGVMPGAGDYTFSQISGTVGGSQLSGSYGIDITGNANTATSASNLGGTAAANYARLDQGNSFSGNQSVTGSVSVSGALAASSGMFSGSTGAGVPLQVVQPARDGVGELATSAGYMGIWGKTTNTSGTGVRGEATTATGASVGVLGVARSLSGIGGRFDNTAGGTILSGTKNGEPRFSVDGSGNVSATGQITGSRLVSAAPSGVAPLVVNSATQVPNLNASLLGGLPASAFAAYTAGAGSWGSGSPFAWQFKDGSAAPPTLGFNGTGGMGIGTTTPANTLDVRGGLREAPGQLASSNGEFVVMRADQDTVHSIYYEEGSQVHLRLSRAAPLPGQLASTQHLMITPYNYGMNIEYPAVLQLATGATEILSNPTGHQAQFWVGDEHDAGGLCTTVHNTRSPATSFASLTMTAYPPSGCAGGADFGSMLFQVVASTDKFQFQTGTQSPTPDLTIWGTGDVSIGNASDLAMLSVGPSGQFQVSSSGALTGPSGAFSGATGGPLLQATQNGSGAGELATSAGYMGIWGKTTNTTGTGVRGEATAATGATVGVFGVARSPSGIAGRFDNTVGGTILSGTRNGEPRFSVDGSGNVSATGQITGSQLVSAAPSGVAPLVVNSATQVPNLNASLLGGLPASAFASLSNANVFTGPLTVSNLFATTGTTVGNLPAQYGQAAILPDNLDSVHSSIHEAGTQMHFRLSRATPDISGAMDLLIAPYTYGMAVEYPGTLEFWTDDFSVHTNQKKDPVRAANFWIGDEIDSGGLFSTARDNGGGTSSYVLLAADRFNHTSHGSLLFQVRNPTDTFQFQSGPWGSAVTATQISTSPSATNLDVYSGSVQGTLRADSGANAVVLGSSSNSPLVFFTGGSGPQATLFPDGNFSIGNSLDQATLSVGSSGQFQVSSGGIVTFAAGQTFPAVQISGTLGASQLSGSYGIDITGNASTATLAATATNASDLGGVVAANYARVDQGNSYSGDQSVTGNVSSTGSLSAGSATLSGALTVGGGTPITRHLSSTATLSYPAFSPQSCNDLTVSVAGAADGDAVALGIPNALASLAGVTWSGWVSASGQVSVRGCNATSSATTAPPSTTVRVDVWQH